MKSTKIKWYELHYSGASYSIYGKSVKFNNKKEAKERISEYPKNRRKYFELYEHTCKTVKL